MQRHGPGLRAAFSRHHIAIPLRGYVVCNPAEGLRRRRRCEPRRNPLTGLCGLQQKMTRLEAILERGRNPLTGLCGLQLEYADLRIHDTGA